MDNPEILATLCTQDEEKPIKNNTICVGHHYKQANTNSVSKTRALLQTTRGKDKPIFCFVVVVVVVVAEIVTNITTQFSERKFIYPLSNTLYSKFIIRCSY